MKDNAIFEPLLGSRRSVVTLSHTRCPNLEAGRPRCKDSALPRVYWCDFCSGRMAQKVRRTIINSG